MSNSCRNAFKLVQRVADDIWPEHGRQIVEEYRTPRSLLEEWKSASREHRLRIFQRHHAHLEGRSVLHLAQAYVPDHITDPLKRSVVTKVLSIAEYEGMISGEERREEHRYRQDLQRYLLLQENGGIHGLSPEVRRQEASNAGKRSHEMGVGVHGLSADQRYLYSQRAAAASLKARGIIPYTNDEVYLLGCLADDPRYQYDSGSHRGKVRWDMVASTVNRVFANDRTTESLRQAYKVKYRNSDIAEICRLTPMLE